MDSECNSRLEQSDLLFLEIDARLAWLWAEAWEVGDWTVERIAPFLRSAYGCGYIDALREEERGELCRDHGLRVPNRGDR